MNVCMHARTHACTLAAESDRRSRGLVGESSCMSEEKENGNEGGDEWMKKKEYGGGSGEG